MATIYREIPLNFDEAEHLLETRAEHIKHLVFTSDTLYFYDTCAFRTHSNLSECGRNRLAEYFKKKNGTIIITRCIFMELASRDGCINKEYISYLEYLFHEKIKVLLLDEEYMFDILTECFSTNARVNEYLVWAVRMSKSPVSTITETLKRDRKLSEEVLGGKNLNSSDLYRRFFSLMRKHKEQSDDLGEELIGICVHIFSYLPGMKDGKLCVITDDKGAAGKIDSLMKKTSVPFRGSKIIIFSTPKLVQHIYQENKNLSEEDIIEILSRGTSGNIVVMGTTAYDLTVNMKISMTCKELAQKIMEPNGIYIVF